jgi:hypothetical protein
MLAAVKSRRKREGQMRTTYKPISAIFALALLAAPAVAQQLAKSGTYTGKFGGEGAGDPYEIGKGHVFFVGHFNFVLFNDVAGGFLDKTFWTCPGVNDIVNGVQVAAPTRGYCIATDKDGDKLFGSWQVTKVTGPGAGEATLQYIGGTGKYSGIQGHWTHRYAFIGNTSAFSAVVQGEWRLP